MCLDKLKKLLDVSQKAGTVPSDRIIPEGVPHRLVNGHMVPVTN